ncbi:MAG: acyl-CoA dehydrogenase family protein [Aeromicrobium sp.]|uniref:acyl-CoA dehydrogenase family protein n=1 Tax=Aeromicrobium sp. TaxID=1871063 RepID=UPI0039E67358
MAEARAAGEPQPPKKDRSGEPNPMLDMLSMGAVVGSEFAGVSLGTLVSPGVSIGLGAATIQQLGTLGHIAAWSITESDSGTDAFGGMKTTVRRDGDGFVLKGSKTFATNGPDADVAVVYAKSLMIYAGSNEVQVTHVAKGLLAGN